MRKSASCILLQGQLKTHFFCLWQRNFATCFYLVSATIGASCFKKIITREGCKILHKLNVSGNLLPLTYISLCVVTILVTNKYFEKKCTSFTLRVKKNFQGKVMKLETTFPASKCFSQPTALGPSSKIVLFRHFYMSFSWTNWYFATSISSEEMVGQS